MSAGEAAPAGRTVTIRYFAWLRERIGRPEETVSLAPDLETVGDVMRWLVSRGPEFAAAFERADVIRAAVDKVHVKAGASVRTAREIAFFPPVTGG